MMQYDALKNRRRDGHVVKNAPIIEILTPHAGSSAWCICVHAIDARRGPAKKSGRGNALGRAGRRR